MSSLVVSAVLLGALLHASWNALVKSRSDTFLATVMVAVGAGTMAALALPFVAAPHAASWAYIGVSTAVQLAYYALLIAAYRHGDMSHAYPLMRGSAPLMVALVSGPLLGEHLGGQQWLAIGCICGGILALFFITRAQHRGAERATVFALLNACMIAAFTLIDGIGVRKSGSPLAYTMWIYMLTAIGLLAWTARTRPGELAGYARKNVGVMLVGGAASLGSYSLAVWAMTKAPVATVAALRETSILFAVAIAMLVLREKVGARRLAAIALVAFGAVAMRLA
ncbi:EamA family transporter [Massilia eurypsychrophila]|jgi:drug/metabolite transporter (DMT)-like permease|uniref:EamA family transporter n=1 Tax=Massilia eurypsychrophila TaxID=1485217 RepID=A0A2G8T919_9BURK|nr:DMT family transporter [Massilia eurypsychrophila]PIL42555.1 EamA family transporter [Massilia eurypsychrophila]